MTGQYIERRLVGTRNKVILFGKPADQEDGGLEFFQRTTLLKLEFRLFYAEKGEILLIALNILMVA